MLAGCVFLRLTFYSFMVFFLYISSLNSKAIRLKGDLVKAKETNARIK